MKPKEIIKDFKIFLEGSCAFTLSRKIKSEKDDNQFLKELNRKLKEKK